MVHGSDEKIHRRRFLKAAGCVASLGALNGSAIAKRLVLVETSGSEQISRVEWIPYQTDQRGPQEQAQQRCAVRITTTHGAQGWSDWSIEALADNDTTLQIGDILLGQSPDDHANLWRRLYEEGVPLVTLGAVDVALWDLRGRMAGKPVHALLGTQRDRARTYLSTGFNLGEPAAYADYAGKAKDKSIGGIKVQPYVEWDTDAAFPDKDMAAYSAVRQAVGDEWPCMADNQGVHSFDDALGIGRLLDDLGYAWYESPMPETEASIDQYIALAKELRSPICAPESLGGAYQSRLGWIDRQACDIARISVHQGGFTASLELAIACENAGVGLELHNVGPDAYPHLQLIGATSEDVVGYAEITSLANETDPLPGRATSGPIYDADGEIAVPQTPGMGLELDWRYIFSHRIR